MTRFKNLFMAWIFPWVPKRLMSRGVGVVMRLPLGPFACLAIPVFAKMFGIDASEAEKRPYRSLDDFFTRRLAPGARPIQGDFVYPVDGNLTEQGAVAGGELLQVKNWTYSLSEFLGDMG